MLLEGKNIEYIDKIFEEFTDKVIKSISEFK
jgi:hypothetical protein